MSEEKTIKVEITRTPAFTEIWHEGSVELDVRTYMF